MTKKNKQLTAQQSEEILKTLKTRFEKNKNRHTAIEWTNVREKA